MPKEFSVKIPDANHPGWLRTFIDDKDLVNDPINGPFIQKLREVKLSGMDPMVYLFGGGIEEEAHRLAQTDPNLYNQFAEGKFFYTYPEFAKHVDVVPPNRGIIRGTARRPIQVGMHGHLGANGGKGSMASYGRAWPRFIIGDYHRAEQTGPGQLNVGYGGLTPGYVNGMSGWGTAIRHDFQRVGDGDLVSPRQIDRGHFGRTPTSRSRPRLNLLPAVRAFAETTMWSTQMWNLQLTITMPSEEPSEIRSKEALEMRSESVAANSAATNRVTSN